MSSRASPQRGIIVILPLLLLTQSKTAMPILHGCLGIIKKLKFFTEIDIDGIVLDHSFVQQFERTKVTVFLVMFTEELF